MRSAVRSAASGPGKVGVCCRTCGTQPGSRSLAVFAPSLLLTFLFSSAVATRNCRVQLLGTLDRRKLRRLYGGTQAQLVPCRGLSLPFSGNLATVPQFGPPLPRTNRPMVKFLRAAYFCRECLFIAIGHLWTQEVQGRGGCRVDCSLAFVTPLSKVQQLRLVEISQITLQLGSFPL